MNAVNRLGSISGNPPFTEGAIRSASHTTGIIPMTERIIADCLSLSRFTGAFLFDNSELFLWGSSDLDDKVVHRIGRFTLVHQICFLVIERTDNNAVFIIVQCDMIHFFLRHNLTLSFVVFACSLRMGEMLGLTWDCIDISEESLKENNASIFVDKELQRVNRDVMEVLDNKDIIRVFPRTLSNTNTSLVLKTPKTKTSVRKIFLPSTVAQMLLERKKQIDEMKELFGDEYLDYDLVFCHSSGRPMEGQVINRALKKLIQDNDLPDVVFHSFRHASITYKLKWNGGDMKSVQGDSGHARMDMVADVYSHIIDEDRRYNAQKFEEQFYNAKGLKNAEEGKTAPMPKFETSVELLDPMAEVQKESEVEKEKPAENSTDENAALLTKLLSNPETAALLKALAKTI